LLKKQNNPGFLSITLMTILLMTIQLKVGLRKKLMKMEIHENLQERD